MVDTKILNISKNERYILSAGSYEITDTLKGLNVPCVRHNGNDLYKHTSIKMCQEFLVRLTNWLLIVGNAEITIEGLMAGAEEQLEEETDE